MSDYVPLASDFSNISAFVTSLFTSGVRAEGNVAAAVRSGQLEYSFVDGTSKGLILNAWLAAWQQHQGYPGYDATAAAHCPDSDHQLLGWLSDWIKDNEVLKCTPNLAYESIAEHDIAKYKNSGYSASPFVDSHGNFYYGGFDANGGVQNPNDESHMTVAYFLKRLFHGAHFVVVCSDGDGGRQGRLDPLLAAYLVGKTSHSNSNAFFQLEGWQSHAPYKGGWHSKDFDAHGQTIWNFSTFGASVYSEKRCAPIFLASKSFNLACDKSTKMPLYNGAGEVDGWMKTGLMDL